MINSIDKIFGLGVWNNYSKPPDLDNFKQYNVIYGWNGVGKTSLSRLFRALSSSKIKELPDLKFTVTVNNTKVTEDNTNLNIDVFNEDFIKHNVRFDEYESNSIRLTLGGNIELLNEIEEYRNLYNINKKEFEDNNLSIIRLQDDINNTFTTLARNATNSANLGRNYNRTSAIGDFDKLEKKPNIPDELFKNAVSIINASSPKDRIQAIPWQHIINSLKSIETELNTILQTNVVRIAIARLDENSDISLWVKHGLELHKKHSTLQTCEFCGNAISAERINELGLYFNEAYKVLDQSISNLTKEIDSTIGEINSINIPAKAELYDSLQDSYTKITKKYSSAKDNTIDNLKKAKTQLLNKRNSPANVIEESASIDTTNLKEAIQNINSIINKHNYQTLGFDRAQKEAVDTIKSHYIQDIYDDVIKKRKKLVELNNTSISLRNKQNNFACKIEAAKKKVSSTAAACDTLNTNIARFLGRDDIRFTTAPDNDASFYIMRKNQPATDLSEGERTAIALSYFILLLESHREQSDLIIVIDDPISSLDSNLRYRAFSFIKNYTQNAHQVFILTHDFDFLHLTINWLSHIKNPGKNVRYYMIENSYDDSDTRSAYLTKMDNALIKYETEYAYLFSLVLDYVDSNDYTIYKAYQMANIGRKLLDSFLSFQVPLFATPFQRLEKIQFDNIKKGAIYKFVNDESHIASSGGIGPQLPHEAHQCMKDLLDMIKTVAPKHYDALVNEIRNSQQS